MAVQRMHAICNTARSMRFTYVSPSVCYYPHSPCVRL